MSLIISAHTSLDPYPTNNGKPKEKFFLLLHLLIYALVFSLERISSDLSPSIESKPLLPMYHPIPFWPDHAARPVGPHHSWIMESFVFGVPMFNVAMRPHQKAAAAVQCPNKWSLDSSVFVVHIPHSRLTWQPLVVSTSLVKSLSFSSSQQNTFTFIGIRIFHKIW